MARAVRRQAYVVIALAVCALQPARAADQWLRLRSPHFELITDAAERHGPNLLLHLEELRRLFIAQLAVPEDAAGTTVRIIAFKSASEFAAYRLIEHTDAYYVGAPGRDLIVMSLNGPADFRTASHEYAHVMANHRGLHLPAWLAEGLAEVFSTARFQPGQAIVGDVNPGRLSSTATQRLDSARRSHDPGQRPIHFPRFHRAVLRRKLGLNAHAHVLASVQLALLDTASALRGQLACVLNPQRRLWNLSVRTGKRSARVDCQTHASLGENAYGPA